MSKEETPDYTPAELHKARHDPTQKLCVDTYALSSNQQPGGIHTDTEVSMKSNSVTTGARCGARGNNMVTASAAKGDQDGVFLGTTSAQTSARYSASREASAVNQTTSAKTTRVFQSSHALSRGR